MARTSRHRWSAGIALVVVLGAIAVVVVRTVGSESGRGQRPLWATGERGSFAFARLPGGSPLEDVVVREAELDGQPMLAIVVREHDRPNRTMVRIGLAANVHSITSSIYHAPAGDPVTDYDGRAWRPCAPMTLDEYRDLVARTRAD